MTEPSRIADLADALRRRNATMTLRYYHGWEITLDVPGQGKRICNTTSLIETIKLAMEGL